MKKLVLLIALFFCLKKCCGQIVELPLPIIHLKKDRSVSAWKNRDTPLTNDKPSFERQSNIVIYPNQYAKFNVSIFTKGHKVFICDTSGHVLYSQIKRKGKYNCATSFTYQYFIIYDMINDTTKNIVGYNPIDQFHRNIIFGYKNTVDALVSITAKLK
jgi:hypothetical protein